MSYRHLPLQCECGEVPDRILEVGFSADHELVVHFWCSDCCRAVYVSKPLTECWRECPEPELTPELQAVHSAETRDADTRFLESLGIRYLDESPPLSTAG